MAHVCLSSVAMAPLRAPASGATVRRRTRRACVSQAALGPQLSRTQRRSEFTCVLRALIARRDFTSASCARGPPTLASPARGHWTARAFQACPCVRVLDWPSAHSREKSPPRITPDLRPTRAEASSEISSTRLLARVAGPFTRSYISRNSAGAAWLNNRGLVPSRSAPE